MTEGFKKELPTKEGYYKCLIRWREGCNTDDDNDYSIIGLHWINRSWHDFNNGGQEIDSIDYKVLGWCEAIPFNPWHTGTPSEEGWYLLHTKETIPYRVAYMRDNHWLTSDSYIRTDIVIEWQKVEP